MGIKEFTKPWQVGPPSLLEAPLAVAQQVAQQEGLHL